MSFGAIVAIAVALFGLIMGSAVSALAWRVPRGESWLHGRSRCTGCGHVLGPLDLVPLLSWLASRGRCRHCGARVSVRYPLTELMCGAWALLALQHEGLTAALPCVLLWGFLLVALLWVDLDFQLLPDAFTLPGVLLAVTAAALDHRLREGLWGMVLGAGLLFLVAEVYFRIRKIEGMGFGDVKLAAMFGALLGMPLTLLALFLAALAGSVTGMILMARGRGGMKTALPFGVFLAPAAMLSWAWGAPLVEAYTRLLRR